MPIRWKLLILLLSLPLIPLGALRYFARREPADSLADGGGETH